jgi:hypothetical protein
MRFRDVPRYFFHLHNDLDVPDEEGLECTDLESAKACAAAQAQILMGETLKEDGRIALSHRIDIEDAQGNVLATVPFKNVVTVEV